MKVYFKGCTTLFITICCIVSICGWTSKSNAENLKCSPSTPNNCE